MRALRVVVPFLVLVSSATVANIGCGAGEDALTEESDITAGSCQVFSAISGKALSPTELANLKDPIAQKLLLGDGCPENFDEISAKFAKTDSNNCAGGGFGDAGPGATGDGAGLKTRLVNDSVFLTGKAEGAYRGVITRDCDGRGRNDLFMSVFGITPNAAKLPQEQTELIGMDRTSGVFNFYVRESQKRQWVFMGSSKDGISAGYTCNADGACIPNASKEARCWACHEGGGINMKELNSPWDSWNLGNGMPGNDEIIKKFGKQLGRAETGIDLERRVIDGNRIWNKTRIEILKAKGAEELLRPLFCTLTVNLQTSGNGKNLNQIAHNFLVADKLRGNSVPVNDADYQALLVDIDQQVTDGQRQLLGKDGPVRDTQNAFRFIEKGEVDVSYIEQLIGAELIDLNFVQDVAKIDFTRPVFSKTRCDLLAFAPKISGADLTPDKIRDGFKKNLAGKSGAAAQLLANLEAEDDAATHEKDIDTFLAACRARPKKEFLADALQVLSNQRSAARRHKGTLGAGRGQGIIEFSETLPVDKLQDTKQTFDPVTCTLK